MNQRREGIKLMRMEHGGNQSFADNNLTFTANGEDTNGYHSQRVAVLHNLQASPQNNFQYDSEEGSGNEDECFTVGGPFIKETKPLIPSLRTSKGPPAVNIKTQLQRPFNDRHKTSQRYEVTMFFVKMVLTVSVLASMAAVLYFLSCTSLFQLHNGNSTDVPQDACSNYSIEEVWIKPFPKKMTEGSIRLLNITKDEVLDIVLPIGLIADSIEGNLKPCDVFFNGVKPCSGGLMAADGKTGEQLWLTTFIHEPFTVACEFDLNNDGTFDCLVAGRGGVFSAVDGLTGKQLWNLKLNTGFLNFYTAQPVGDIDKDGVIDFLQAHGGDPQPTPEEKNRPIGRMMIVSGKTGKPIIYSLVHDRKEIYYSPQILTRPDGQKVVLFGTGGETIHGGLYVISLNDFITDNSTKKARLIYENPHKGVMVPPVLVDINGDKTSDIILPTFNGSLLAIDGDTFKVIWNAAIDKHGETYASAGVGYFDDDDIPDFMVVYSIGLGYPIYYYCRNVIVSGKDGKIIKELPRSSLSVISSPITISFEGQGYDKFIYWTKDCLGKEGQQLNYTFSFGIHQSIKSRTELCREFNTTYLSRMQMFGQNMEEPGVNIYNSDRYFHHENVYSMEAYRREAFDFVIKHPQHLQEFKDYFHLLTQSNSYKFKDELDYSKVPKAKTKSKKKKLIDVDDEDEEESRASVGDDDTLERKKRHIGPHDDQGATRLISTPSLAPSYDTKLPPNSSSIDLIFATYQNAQSETNLLMTPKEKDCVKRWQAKESQRFDKNNKFYGYDTDRYQNYVHSHCMKLYGDLKSRKAMENEKIDTQYFELSHLQLTLYRMRITCHCNPGDTCSRILPYSQQRWPAYSGRHANSYMLNPIPMTSTKSKT